MGLDALANPYINPSSFTDAFSKNLQAATAPQQAYMKQLMDRVALAKATNPIDTNLIDSLLGRVTGGVDRFQRQVGFNAVNQAQAGDPNAISKIVMSNPDTPPAEVQEAIKDGRIGLNDLKVKDEPITISSSGNVIKGEGPDPQPKSGQTIPEELAALSTAPTGNPSAGPVEAIPQAPISLTDPNATAELAGGIDLRKIPSTATEDLAKLVTSNAAMMGRYLAPAYSRVVGDEINNQAKHEDTAAKIQGQKDVQRIKNAGKTNSSPFKPMTQTQIGNYIRDNFPHGMQNVWMPQDFKNLMTTVDSTTDPGLKLQLMSLFGDKYAVAKSRYGGSQSQGSDPGPRMSGVQPRIGPDGHTPYYKHQDGRWYTY